MSASGAAESIFGPADRGTRAAAGFVLRFFTPLLLTLPCLGVRHEPNALPPRERALAWLLAAPAALVIYGIALLTLGPSPAAEVRVDGGPLAIAVLGAGVFPWTLCAFL